MSDYLFEIVSCIAVAVAGYVGIAIKSIIKKYLNDATKRKVAAIGVSAVEQVYKELHGDEKLSEAELMIEKILRSKGIKISAEELDALIQDAVFAMNQSKPLELISTLDTTSDSDIDVSIGDETSEETK